MAEYLSWHNVYKVLHKDKFCKIMCIRFRIVRVYSKVLVAFLYFDICNYRQSNFIAIENPEFSQSVVAGHFQCKIW